ncbi:Rrp15p-domain-containing protein [Cladochytrium replicatum]|nr:Rrp15p-domain-containing protein [Cladochytrium replicatum]
MRQAKRKLQEVVSGEKGVNSGSIDLKQRKKKKPEPKNVAIMDRSRPTKKPQNHTKSPGGRGDRKGIPARESEEDDEMESEEDDEADFTAGSEEDSDDEKPDTDGAADEGEAEKKGTDGAKGKGMSRMASTISKLLSQDLGQTSKEKPILSKRKSITRQIENAALEKKARKALADEKKEKQDKDRVVPDVTTMDYEKRLRKIATRGVVQLFNAIRMAQKSAEEVKATATSMEAVKEVTKGTFLTMLKGATPESGSTSTKANTSGRQPVQSSAGVRWLSSDYMTAPAQKHWDEKNSDDDL